MNKYFSTMDFHTSTIKRMKTSETSEENMSKQ